MHIVIVYPAIDGLNNGNLVTAQRWQQRFVALGHSVQVAPTFEDADHDGDVVIELLIALHAIKSAPSIEKFRQSNSNGWIVVVLTGTDIYNDQARCTVQRSLRRADQVVVLQPATVADVPAEHREKVNVIFQSVEPYRWAAERTGDRFEVSVVGHLRPVKDPFQAAWAVRNLPAASKIRVTQIGGAMTESMRQCAQKQAEENPRYRWTGEVTRDESMRMIAASDLLVNSSRIEGGAAVICEAVVSGTPILATRNAGNVGFLGEDYEGLFNVGDTIQLREMLLAAETDSDFYQRLKIQCESRKHLFEPEFELRSWAELLAKLDRSR